jgi:predicted nucleotidyltransferase component of viral defense system
MSEAKESKLKAQLRLIAGIENRTINDVWKQLILERFLARLSNSKYRDHFIFKGALLLARYLPIGRETADADFLIKTLTANQESMTKSVSEIAGVELKDGFSFSFKKIEILEQPHMEYVGYRCLLSVTFGKMKDTIGLDVGIGDKVNPKNIPIKLLAANNKPLFESEVILSAYPVETILAEKLESMFYRAGTTSRMKDFHDALLIFREGKILNEANLKKSISATFTHRGTDFAPPLTYTPSELSTLQTRWTAHVRGLAKHLNMTQLPTEFSNIISELNQYLANLQN